LLTSSTKSAPSEEPVEIDSSAFIFSKSASCGILMKISSSAKVGGKKAKTKTMLSAKIWNYIQQQR